MERLFERTPYVRRLAAHNVILATKPPACSPFAWRELGDDQPVAVAVDRPQQKPAVELAQEPLELLVAAVDRMVLRVDARVGSQAAQHGQRVTVDQQPLGPAPTA